MYYILMDDGVEMPRRALLDINNDLLVFASEDAAVQYRHSLWVSSEVKEMKKPFGE